jgi:peptidoglycan/xylan/chitin deacetylase (PgdA/CDA1 family)
MWYHCRWATGGPKSAWLSPEDAVEDFYGGKDSGLLSRDFSTLANTILDLFGNLKIKATFFILGEMAKKYPRIVKLLSDEGHEIASHGMRHVDATYLDDAALRDSVTDSKKLLEDLTGLRVNGFRYPNLLFAKRELAVLVEQGYTYDSSVCFSRKLFGKFGTAARMIPNPYRPDLNEPFHRGSSDFWEFPIPVLPVLRLPAGSGIATRLMGLPWSKIALNAALRTGDALYYFHPFDLHRVKRLNRTSLNAFFFLQNAGPPFKRQLTRLLRHYAERIDFTCIRDWITLNGRNETA